MSKKHFYLSWAIVYFPKLFPFKPFHIVVTRAYKSLYSNLSSSFKGKWGEIPHSFNLLIRTLEGTSFELLTAEESLAYGPVGLCLSCLQEEARVKGSLSVTGMTTLLST